MSSPPHLDNNSGTPPVEETLDVLDTRVEEKSEEEEEEHAASSVDDVDMCDAPRKKRVRGQQSDAFPAPTSQCGRLKLAEENRAEIAKLERLIEEEKQKSGLDPQTLKKNAKRRTKKTNSLLNFKLSLILIVFIDRYWSMDEHEKFLTWIICNRVTEGAGMQVYKLAEFIETRSSRQCRSHAQKFFNAIHDVSKTSLFELNFKREK